MSLWGGSNRWRDLRRSPDERSVATRARSSPSTCASTAGAAYVGFARPAAEAFTRHDVEHDAEPLEPSW